jgi:zinc transport system substrate-binding protein
MKMIKKTLFLLLAIISVSCGRKNPENNLPVITVSISPYKFFIDRISGGDYNVNIMVPPGSNPHIYEPYPKQIDLLRRSVAYISNGLLGFEMTWLDRFYEINPAMQKLDLSKGIVLIDSGHDHEGDHDHGESHTESADPHYWVSPACAMIMVDSIAAFLSKVNPSSAEKYLSNGAALREKIALLHTYSDSILKPFQGRSFMIYHPNLAYVARDFGLTEVAVEFEGKEPPPSQLKSLIDMARKERINAVFVQKEYDAKNAKAIADEIDAEVHVIDPLAENWMEATTEIIRLLEDSLKEK